ncbi:MAG TPA: V-type ATPase 116kDa subunit family protein [Candidatus Hydrogenedentes bacterium]|nr:V-type ATPase 116kDa subunit family protein [Candidatus Hydrogenedentota bacterium]
MMLVAEKMSRFTAVILRDDMQGVMEEVARAGVLHLTSVEETESWARDLADIDVKRLTKECLDRKTKLEGLVKDMLSEHGAPESAGFAEVSGASLAEIDAVIASAEAAITPLSESRIRLTDRLSRLQATLSGLDALVPPNLPLARLLRSSMLYTAVGVIAQNQLPKLESLLKDIPSVVVPYRRIARDVHVVCLVLQRNKETLRKALHDTAFAELPIPQDVATITHEAKGALLDDLQSVETQLSENKAALRAAQEAAWPAAAPALQRLSAGLLILRIQDSCKVTERTCVFAGWVPRDQAAALVDAIREKTHGRAIVEVTEAESLEPVQQGEVEVPVLFNRPKFLQPFALLTEGFAIPSYTMIDPTLFVAISFLLMFGMMFGDAGHGLVLCALGVLFVLKAPQYKDVGKLAIYCGAASVIFGLLYGSIFGLEHLLPALWTKPLEGINDLFAFAIVFGILFVSLGIILNVLNAIRAHAFWESLFDGAGPLVGIIYWSGIGLVVKSFFSTSKTPHSAWLVVPMALALTGFLLKGPLLRLFGKQQRAFPEGAITYVMESAVEVMEVFMGYLANTVSFIRVAAFGLAHAGLFVAVFSLAEIVSGAPGGRLLSFIVIVAGNVLIIVLEGVVVTIQALRLEYYEFFGKFFNRTGQKYAPVGVSSTPQDAAN